MNTKNKKDLATLSKIIKESTDKTITKNNYDFERLDGINLEVVKILHHSGIELKQLLNFYQSRVS